MIGDNGLVAVRVDLLVLLDILRGVGVEWDG